MYFHTWELDPDQPKINSASWFSRVRQYRNLDRMPGYLRYFLNRYEFTSAADYLGLTAAPMRFDEPRRTPRPSGPIVSLVPPAIGGASGARALLASGGAALDVNVSSGGDGQSVAAAVTPAQATPVTVVVPCFNEELILPYLANTLASVESQISDYSFTFIFVDDRSTDGTWAALHRIFGERPNCIFVRHAVNQGVAAGILTGIQRATTDIVCSMDCDCTYDPHELGRMIPLLTDGVDLVTASPYHPLGRVRNLPRWRLTLSKSLSRLYRLVLHTQLATYTSCFRVYRRSTAATARVANTGFLGVAEMLGSLDLQGAKIVEFPTTLEVRMIGRSKMKVIRTIIGHLGLLARLGIRRLLLRPAP
jgi:hypothetical protein